MVNTIEPSVCVGDATLCQITMTIDHIKLTYIHILCKQIKVNMFQCTNEQRQMIGRDNFWQWVQILNTRTAKKCFLQLTLESGKNNKRVPTRSWITNRRNKPVRWHQNQSSNKNCNTNLHVIVNSMRSIPNKAQRSSPTKRRSFDLNPDRRLVNRHCTDSSWFISVTDTGNHTLLASIS